MKSTARTPDRNAFTLVELLVVVGIIAVLAALLTPAVMRARSTARNAAIKVEIDMLHMALMNYKNEYGSFPPAFSAPVAGGPSARHIQRLFPRCTTVLTQVGSGTMTPQIAIGKWLKGYTSDPTLPITGAGGRKRLYDFDQSRLTAEDAYAPPGQPLSPYVYIDSANYFASGTIPLFTVDTNTYFAHRVPTAAASTVFNNPAQPAFNPDTFQILCAGVDGVFGTDDDLSNFWKGTRREYVDNLRNE